MGAARLEQQTLIAGVFCPLVLPRDRVVYTGTTMALSIKNDEADQLARELAETTGESITDAVVISLRQRLERERRKPGTRKKLLDLAAEVAEYPVLDDRTPDQIIGYDEFGLPN